MSAQWNLTNQSKPEFDRWVLCWCKIYGYYIGKYEQIEDTGWGQWNNGEKSGYLPPIYWQHLPAVPYDNEDNLPF